MKKKLLFLLSTLMLGNSFAQSDTTFNIEACGITDRFSMNINGNVTHIGGNSSSVVDSGGFYTLILTDLNSNNQNIFSIGTGQGWINPYIYPNSTGVVQTGTYRLVLYTSPTDSTVVTWNISDCDWNVHCQPTSVDVYSPWLRRCDTATYYVNYSNMNPNPVTGAYVDVELQNNLTFIASSQAHTTLPNGKIRFDLGNLPSGLQYGSFTFDAYVNCEGTVMGETHCVTAEIFPHNSCTSTTDTTIVVEPVDSNLTDSVYFRLRSNVNGLSTHYRIYEDEFLGRTGLVNVGTTPTTIAYRRNAGASIHRLEADAVSRSINVNQTPSANILSDSIRDTTGIVIDFPSNDGEAWVSTSCRQNADSYDPNEKQAFPRGYGEQHYIDQNVDLDYVIHFQNEGTADAIRVVVEDEIDADLDLSTFVAGSATHRYEVLKTGNTIKFIFDNIHLAPKSVDEAGSMGAVKFSIRQKVNNPLGTVITNTAKIYFDYNAAIVTNTVKHIIGKPETYSQAVSVEEMNHSIPVSVYPNPSSDVINFSTEGSSIYELELLDLSGRIITQQIVNGTSTSLNVADLPKGIYVYQLKGKSTILSVGKVVVK